MMKMQRNFVIFYSPGTFVAETSEQPINTWDTTEAMTMARGIKERHGATPYGFRFITRSRDDADLDSKESARSVLYFLGGEVKTLAEVEKSEDPKSILLFNMRANGYGRIIINTNSWKWTQPLDDSDIVLEFPL